MVTGNLTIDPRYDNHAVNHSPNFTPIATIIGFVFLGVSFAMLALAKLWYASSDHYMTNNRFDLVIFKQPTKRSILGGRKIYNNTKASAHNLAAAQACGFDFSKINNRKSNFMTGLDLTAQEQKNMAHPATEQQQVLLSQLLTLSPQAVSPSQQSILKTANAN